MRFTRWRRTSAAAIWRYPERLAGLCGDRVQRIGLSATQKPIDDVARFLVGAGGCGRTCSRDHRFGAPSRPRLGVGSPRFASRSGNVRRGLGTGLPASGRPDSGTPNDAHFRQYSPVSRARDAPPLRSAWGGNLAAHHGSLAKEKRLDAEQRLKHGKLKALIATASLELGIDIGDVDLVCQLGSPRSIASFLQRVAAAMQSTARQRAGCFRCRATNWSSAQPYSTACAAASSTVSPFRGSRSMSLPSRSSPK